MLDPRLETVVSHDDSAINCVHRSCPDLAEDHGWHFHPQFELTLFMHSTGTRYVGDNVARYEPGDLVLSGPNLPHCWRNDIEPQSDDAEWLTVQFEAQFMGPGFFELPEAADLRRLLDEARLGLVFPSRTAAVVKPRLFAIRAARGLEGLLKLADLLDLLSKCERMPLASPAYHRTIVIDQERLRRLETVNAYIADHFRGTISQVDAAQLVGLNPVTFSKFMRAATGYTFSGLIKIARINEACRLLANSDEPITGVALDCGYQHTSHFDRQFMELKGMTPSAYRRKMRDLVNNRPGN